MNINCKTCGKEFTRPIQRGRPAVRCETCRTQGIVAPSNSEETHQKVLNDEDGIIPPTETEQSNAASKKTSSKEDDYPYLFRLMVGNMGLAYAGEDEREAVTNFNSFAKKSSMGFGQVGFEAVQLWKLNREQNQYELNKEFLPQR